MWGRRASGGPVFLFEIMGTGGLRAEAAMLAFLLFVIFCIIVWALFRNGNQGIALFLVIAFLVWGFFGPLLHGA